MFLNAKENKFQPGYGCWNSFKETNMYRIICRGSQKCEMDRNKWTTYRNFASMHDRIIV